MKCLSKILRSVENYQFLSLLLRPPNMPFCQPQVVVSQLLSPQVRLPTHWLSASQSPSPLTQRLVQRQQESFVPKHCIALPVKIGNHTQNQQGFFSNAILLTISRGAGDWDEKKYPMDFFSKDKAKTHQRY